METNKKNRFEILKRKYIGESKLSEYKLILEKLSPYHLIDIERSDLIIEKLANITYPCKDNELIKEQYIQNFEDSNILKKVYNKLLFTFQCYVYTDDYLYCGICLANARKAIIESLQIAKRDDGNTCFLLDNNFSFYILINYYDNTHNDYPNCFDIQISSYL